MIRIEDLMVGNFAFGVLNGERKCFSVTDIITHEPSPTRMIFSEDEEISPFGVLANEGAIEGIPVTVDILKRIGFEAHKGICPKTFYRYWDKEYRYVERFHWHITCFPAHLSFLLLSVNLTYNLFVQGSAIREHR